MADWITTLKELPIVSSGSVPKSGHPNMGEYEGKDYTDPQAVARTLTDKSPHLSHDHIEGYTRGGGIETTYSIYRIAENTWRIVEESRYTD